MAYRVKKFRGYRRMLRKLIRVVEDYQPDWRPDEADGREEFLELDLYSHRFFHPRGKGRKALFSALLRKTEALIAAKPRTCPSAKYSSLCLGETWARRRSSSSMTGSGLRPSGCALTRRTGFGPSKRTALC